MKSAWKLCAILFLATGLVAQTTPAPKPKKAKPAAAATITAADVQALKDALASQAQALAQQQQELKELREELHRKDQAVQQAQSTATDAAGKADAAQAAASQDQQSVVALKSDVGDLKTGMANTVSTLQETQKVVKEGAENPVALHYKGITITPGGFLAAEFVRRSRALAGEATPFNSLTLPGASQNATSEFFGSGRQSRLSVLAQGQVGFGTIGGYYEADFLGVGTSSNNNQTNSYPLRQRQAFAQIAANSGWTFTGGQMWTLLTETRHGTDNRTEATPMTIDPNYNVGFTFARQYGLRLSKNFSNKAWFAVSMENSQATVTSHGNGANFLVGSTGAGGGLYNGGGSPTGGLLASYSFNPSPDVIAKLVLEPGFGHYEVFGVFSRFRDRVFPCGEANAAFPCNGATTPSAALAYNSSKNGGGIGANARWSFASKHVDFGLHAFGGSGVGRYAASGLPDASVHANGTLDLIRTYQGLATLEFHGPKMDVYFNAGADYASRAFDYDPISGKYVGYGAGGPGAFIGSGTPNGGFSNSGCYLETPPGAGGFIPGSLGSCTGDTRVVIEGTAGFWFKVYDGSKEKVNRGRVQWGPQFSYVDRNTWSGSNGEPHGLDGMIYTSFRYYLP